MQNKIILGTVQFGLNYGINNHFGRPNDNQLHAILFEALDRGIQILDSAEAYGDALERIGNFHRSSHKKFELISKFSSTLLGALETHIKKQCEIAGIDSFYGYLFHSFSDYLTNKKKLGSLTKLKAEGLLRYIGVSVYTNEELSLVIDDPYISIVQLPYNLLDNFHQRGELMKKAKEKGKILHVRSVFLQGLFFKDNQDIQPIFNNLLPHLTELKRISLANGVNIGSLALNYALCNNMIDGVLIGVDSVKQLIDNFLAIQPLDEETIEQIDSIKISDIQLLDPRNWK
jgi:uncharacterized protein